MHRLKWQGCEEKAALGNAHLPVSALEPSFFGKKPKTHVPFLPAFKLRLFMESYLESVWDAVLPSPFKAFLRKGDLARFWIFLKKVGGADNLVCKILGHAILPSNL